MDWLRKFLFMGYIWKKNQCHEKSAKLSNVFCEVMFPGAKGRPTSQHSSCPPFYSYLFSLSSNLQSSQMQLLTVSSFSCLWAFAHPAFSAWNTVSSSSYLAISYFTTQFRFHLF